MHPAIDDHGTRPAAKSLKGNVWRRGISAALREHMSINTKASSQFASIDHDLLAGVQGGCGGRRRRCGGCKNVNIVNNYAAPAPAAPAPSGGGPAVDVSVGYQQA